MSTLDERLLRQLFDDAVRRSGAVGAQLSIIKTNQQLDFATGFADASRKLTLNTGTLMQIGSVTKVFNAALVMCLVEEGVLDLDVPVCHYLPEFRVADAQGSRTLTLRHLLSMSSGLDNGPYVCFGAGEDALGRYVGGLDGLPRHFAPGRHFGYSNAGACIAGHVAARVADKPWEALLHERILDPAGLAQFALLDSDLMQRRVSFGHFAKSGGGQLHTVEPIFSLARSRAPSGSTLAMSASTMARFGRLFVEHGRAERGTQVLSASSVAQMLEPQTNVPTRKYGTSWCIGPYMSHWSGVAVWGHAGTSLTAISFLHWIPSVQGVLAFSLNTHAAMGAFAAIVFDEILPAVFGFHRPRFDLPEAALSPAPFSRYAGTYEELGASLDVFPGEGSALRAHFLPRSPANGLEQRAILTPLGGDRFLVNPLGSPDRQRGLFDMAFFGEDAAGRAAHALNLVFPMSRRPAD